MHKSKSKRNDFFNLSVTEFILIFVFLLLLLLSYQQSNYDALKESTDKDAVKIVSESGRLERVLKDLSEKFGIEYFNAGNRTLSKIENSRKAIEKINSYITKPISIKENWENIVLASKAIEAGGLSSDSLRMISSYDAKTLKSLEQVIGAYGVKGIDIKQLTHLIKISQENGFDIGKLASFEKTEESLTFCEDELKKVSKACGTGYPICRDKGTWLLEIVLEDQGFRVSEHFSTNEKKPLYEVPLYSLNEFVDLADEYFMDSRRQRPECRYQVKVYDQTNSKSTYKRYLKIIDFRFYKKEFIK